ncbi:MAG: hypothetical protein BECKG1743D_GA0114223_101111, partial [Candidatus Kentron sp. G]
MSDYLSEVVSELKRSCTSTAAPKFGYPLCGKGFALISPFEGFSHGCVEVIDESHN